MAQTRLKSGNLHMVGGDNGSDGNVLKSKGDGTMEWGAVIVNPTFSSFDYPGDDTALDPAGGQSLVINGSGFNSGVTVTIGGTTPSSITLNSAAQITVATPAKSAGSQALVITNTDGGTASTNVSYNGIPAFTNAAGSLASVKSGTTINVSAAATEPDGGAITYAVTSGALPSGVSLNTSTGAITGTAPSVDASTTSNFTVTATDNENQSTARAYSITVTPQLPSDKFKIVTYTGNGGTQGINVGFKPDFVWIKQTNAENHSRLLDSTRGATKILYSSLNYAEDTESTGLTAFTSTGFNLGAQQSVNDNNDTYIAWCWKANGGTTSSNTDGTITSTVQANTDAGFSIATWDGNGSSASIGHGLGVAPDMLLVKNLDGTNSWIVRHKDFNGYLSLEQNNAGSSSDVFGTAPDATKYYFNTAAGGNGYLSGNTYVGYFFASIDGFSKFGSYTGTGSTTNRPIVETGFEPAFVMIKNASASGSWMIHDNKRNTTNPRINYLRADYNYQDGVYAEYGLDFFTNGFQIGPTTNGSWNSSGHTFIYMAFAEDPDTTAPTLANSFNAKTYTGNGGTQSITGIGFRPNMTWIKHRNEANDHVLTDSIRHSGLIYPNGNDAQNQDSQLTSFDSDGFSLAYASGQNVKFNKSGGSYISWAWKADDNEPTIEEVTEDADAIAIYKFEDNVDDVTNNYDGTATSISYNGSGKFNKSATFNGSSSKIVISSFGTFLASNNNKSWSAWFKTSKNSGGNIAIVSDYGANGNYNFDTYLTPSNGKINLVTKRNGTNQNGLTSAAYNDGNWHHAAVTQNMSTGKTKLYIDAALQFTLNSGTGSGQNGPLHIGTYGSGYYWDGDIDQVRIYNKALDQASVTNLYNEGVAQNGTLNIGTKQSNTAQSIVSANENAGFSIVKWTGDGIQGSKVPHGLSAAPELIIMKDLSASNHWVVGNSESGWTKAMHLDLNNADNASNLYWDDTAPTSTVFSLGHHSTAYNVSGNDYIAYCWHSISGYSKIGSYTGNGSTTGPVVTTGFQPNFLIYKASSQSGNWGILDSVRDTNNPRSEWMAANLSNTESSETTREADFLSTGFQPKGTNSDINTNGQTYVYMAFKIN